MDACVNYANTLSSWAAVESARGEAGKASQLLVAAVEGCRRALEQEEDAAVSPLALTPRPPPCSTLYPVLQRLRELGPLMPLQGCLQRSCRSVPPVKCPSATRSW